MKDIFSTETSIIHGYIVDKLTNEVIDKWHRNNLDDNSIIVLCLNPDDVQYYEEANLKNTSILSIVPYAPAFRRIRNNRILLDDKFVKKERNADYLDIDDQFFSNDHNEYIDDGYIGFSDYSIVGEEYTETGFAPYAVAIHIVYFDGDNILRIHHFVSDTNDDISDPAGKFYEALEKLIEWNSTKGLDTLGMKRFEEIYKEQSYPGLGVVKKLSIMHHLELISRFMDGKI